MSTTYSLRLDHRLKQESEQIAKKYGISLNQYVKACLIAANTQEQTIESLRSYVAGRNLDRARQDVQEFISQDFEGDEPAEEIEALVRKARERHR